MSSNSFLQGNFKSHQCPCMLAALDDLLCMVNINCQVTTGCLLCLCCLRVLWHDLVVRWNHWRVDESGWTGHDEQQSPVSQWFQAAQWLWHMLTCIRTSESSDCHQGTVCTHNLSYSKVCGQIIAYQVGSIKWCLSSCLTIDDNYVDGISLAHGNPLNSTFWSLQKHVCTFPCFDGTPLSFVGTDFICETGNVDNHH
jgi:hypothetical protein